MHYQHRIRSHQSSFLYFELNFLYKSIDPHRLDEYAKTNEPLQFVEFDRFQQKIRELNRVTFYYEKKQTIKVQQFLAIRSHRNS